MTSFTREINRLLAAFLVVFGLMIIAATYYATIGQQTLLPRDDNPRVVEAERRTQRGTIYDRHNTPLVETIQQDGTVVRRTNNPAVASATGYFSYRYGANGIEAAYDDLLSGRNLPPNATELLLAQPRTGSDIRLTLDLDVQLAVIEAMGSTTGAAIVMTVPNGEVLALASLPTYNPNTLDSDWEMLTAAPGEPFFNRSVQGRYQPGSMMQLPVLVTAMVTGQTLNVKFPSGAVPIELDDLTLTCTMPPPQSEMTLREAFLFGCPAPFSQISPNLGIRNLQETFRMLNLDNSVRLAAYNDPNETTLPNLTRGTLQKTVLGQGDLSVSPLTIAALTAATINDGNAPVPRIAQAFRMPKGDTWQTLRNTRPTSAYITAQNARRVSEIMRESANIGTASGVDWGELDIGGQTGLAYSGERTLQWFTGFAVLENKQNIVVTVILEDPTDSTHALRVAREAIIAADTAITPTEASNSDS